ncbi:MAG TPA: glycosyl transferase family 90 [Muribaculum sp.]|jgi:hypothetical protein|uniref:Glycosyl transferase family 90 n=1 Tax=Heminiphilus faecis TaxID=2601703 RepID=A0ABV4CUV1_9BACT|nr:glycosyl transferase family 90 [Heminiphilus faecis]RLT75748.1 lipopolysaccharide biosynthesis protein [bacterium J10(2018)]HRF69288.1 glycosyl transferase family 90 [Muribaculum sp.]
MSGKLSYLLRSGKNSKQKYFAINYLRQLIPEFIFRKRLESVLEKASRRDDIDYIKWRVDYYNKLRCPVVLPPESPLVRDHAIPRKQKVYYFDTYEFLRWFPQDYHWGYCPGDVTFIPDCPSIVKSRPIAGDNENSVVMKLDKIRHFIFVKDKKKFADKRPTAIFRGKVGDKELRMEFMRKFYGSDICDAGDVSRDPKLPPEWHREKMTISDHLDYMFIMALEGNDVASNLKWVMSSNSLAVMPRPVYETWFMEGLLKPGVHYVEIESDFSDLDEKMRYYASHHDEAQKIIDNAHEWVDQFRDKERENIISLLVLDKYFRLTGGR